MTHPYDNLHHGLILGLRRGRDVAESALLAHHTQRGDRAYHINSALEYFDELAKAVADLRAEMARLDVDQREEVI